ncbi:MAG: hypothetical protein OXI11_11090 [Gammaproteobacteria bacterium]|nr:hypothetical protein [Gammaproteobacteria bacterium]
MTLNELKATLDSFSPVKIAFGVGDQVAAVVAIDRSDAKITVRRIELSACTVHAEWDRA